MDLELGGKRAVVTGGTAGIGLAVAKGLAAEGARVFVAGRDQGRVDAAVAELRDGGADAAGYAADVADAAQVDALAAAVGEAFGGADILVNNAGTGSNETVLDAADAKWQAYWDLHVMAAVRLARALAPGMKAAGGGVILHNASICATQPLYYEPIYNVTKAALVMFSKCLAAELIGDGIRVNAVNPGLVLTGDWIKTAKQLTEGTDRTWEQYLQGIADENAPIGRFATPEEVADLFVFLASARASYIVGSTTYVDGGWLRTTS